MTQEKIEFRLPMVFSFAPILPEDDLEATIRYARYFSDSTDDATLRRTILGIVEGETRALTAEMTVEDVFHKRDMFKSLIEDRVGLEIKELGLRIINANIKELMDSDENNKYFTYRKQRAIETANYEAQVAVSEAQKVGKIGIMERQTATRIALSRLDSQVQTEENKRSEEISISEGDLQEAIAAARQRKEVADIESNMAVRSIESDLQQQVEIIRQRQTLEQLRADRLGQTKVEAEQQIVWAEGQSQSKRVLADAILHKEVAESSGMFANLSSHGKGLSQIMDAAGQDASVVKFYLALDSGVLEKLAVEQANALQGMKPNISIWNTGGSVKVEGAQNMPTLVK